MINLFRLLKTQKVYSRVLLALFVSGLGTALTSVAVYAELAKQNVGPFGFGVAFGAGLLPGFLTSILAGRFSHKWNIRNLLIGGEVLGLVSLSFPLISAFNHSIYFLVMAEITASAVGGLLLPAFKGIERSAFSDEAFSSIAALDSWILTANFIVAQGLGSILASQISLSAFLLIDAFTYVFAIVVVWPLNENLKISENSPAATTRPRNLNREQIKSLFILPWLALVCAPPMILLPARATLWGLSANIGFGLTIAPVLLIISFRTLGQLLGPLIASKTDVNKIIRKSWSLAALLTIYLLFYVLAYELESLLFVLLSITLAHIASNLVYTVGNYQLLKSFNVSETVWASGWVYRCFSVVTGFSGLIVGFLASEINPMFTLIWSFTALLFGGLFLFFPEKSSAKNFGVQI